MSKEDRIDYLDEERKKLWKSILELREQIDKTTPEYEAEARQASRKCSEFRNRCEDAKNEALTAVEITQNSLNEINSIKDEIVGIAHIIRESKASVRNSTDTINSVLSELTVRKEELEESISNLESIFDSPESYSEKLRLFESWHSESLDVVAKTKALFTQITARKAELDELYYEIIGIPASEESNQEEIIGLKTELENAFSDLKTNFVEFEKNKKEEVSSLVGSWEEDFDDISKKIKALLPNALTAGLSHAYSEKKNDELAETLKLDKSFNRAIYGLIFVSLIPFAINISLLLQGKSLEASLLQMPRLVLAILPLYVPILWVAYSTNKKLNLSKRLIEEYTHKEVLSKTYEGLSEQISNLDNSKASKELRAKLLYNILEVSSENPGKLISNYDKSDHPLMDALEKSVQLTNAVDKLDKIPGLSKIATYLDKKTDKLLATESLKAEKGIEMVEKAKASEKLET